MKLCTHPISPNPLFLRTPRSWGFSSSLDEVHLAPSSLGPAVWDRPCYVGLRQADLMPGCGWLLPTEARGHVEVLSECVLVASLARFSSIKRQ